MNNKFFFIKARIYLRAFTCLSILCTVLSCGNNEENLTDFTSDYYTTIGDFGNFKEINSLNTSISRYNGQFYIAQYYNNQLYFFGFDDTLSFNVDTILKVNDRFGRYDEYIHIQDSIVLFSTKKSDKILFYNLAENALEEYHISIDPKFEIRGTFLSPFNLPVKINSTQIAFPFTKAYDPSVSLNTLYKGKTSIGILEINQKKATLIKMIGQYPEKYLESDFREHSVNLTLLDSSSYAISFSKSNEVFVYDRVTDSCVAKIKLKPDYPFKSMAYGKADRKEEVGIAETSVLLFGLKKINDRTAARFVSNNPEKRLELLIYNTTNWKLRKRFNAQNVLPSLYVHNNNLYLLKKVNETVKLVKLNDF